MPRAARRRILTFGAALALFAALVLAAVLAPAGATPPGAGNDHKVVICHVTNSPRNPWVIVEVDAAAFDGAGVDDHTHHVAKDGRTDTLATSSGCDDAGG